MPKGMVPLSSFRNIVSITAKLVLRNISADFLLTILIAAYFPVTACLAFLTLPEAPLPTVLPSCHGPICVLRRDLPDALVEALEICESRLEFRASSLEMAEMRLSSAFATVGMGSFKAWRLPPGARDPWCGMLGGEDEY